VFCFGERRGRNALGWEPAEVLAPMGARAKSLRRPRGGSFGGDRRGTRPRSRAGDEHGGFGGVHDKLLAALGAAAMQERAA